MKTTNTTSNRAWWLEQVGSVEEPGRASRRKTLLRVLLGVVPTVGVIAVIVVLAYLALVVSRMVGLHPSLQGVVEAVKNLLGS